MNGALKMNTRQVNIFMLISEWIVWKEMDKKQTKKPWVGVGK